MAGRGPAPGANPNKKDPDHRRRRNVEPSFDVLPAEGYQGEFPPLPACWRVEQIVLEVDEETEQKVSVVRTIEIPFLPETCEWYATWARSPMAVKFTATDWTRLRQLAPLVDQYERKPSKDLAGELRLQESLLGATVMDRQRMRMRVAESEEDAPAKPKLAEVRRLRAIDATG
jgi:hypothetical protein